MISGASDNPCGCQLISSVHRLTESEGINPWFERVNTTAIPQTLRPVVFLIFVGKHAFERTANVSHQRR